MSDSFSGGHQVKKPNNIQCYNCENKGTTREHIIPRFFLLKNDNGLTVSCCETCQKKLKWLDDYAADYFRYQKSQDSIDEWEKWYKQAIIQNGSPFALRLFGEDTVTNEDTLMRSIHKICVGKAYHLYGKLDESYRLNIITNFSKLGGYCQYNPPGEKSYTEELTMKILNSRNLFYDYFNHIFAVNSIVEYEVKNAKIIFTGKEIMHGAMWLNVILYNRFNITCAVVNGISSAFAQSRNMLLSSLPIRINLNELDQHHREVKQTKRGDSIVFNLANCPTSNDSRALRKAELEAAGVSTEDIEKFENSLTDLMENKGGKERLAKLFLNRFKNKIF